MATRGRTATKPAVEETELDEEFEEETEDGVEVEGDEDIEESGEDDLDDLELEEVEDLDEDDVVEEEAPQKKGKRPAKKAAPKKPAANAVEFGTAELLALIEKEHGKAYDGRQLRVLLRKMKAAGELPGEAADGKRYAFTGATDPQVQAIIQRVKNGEIDEATKAALEKLKTDAEAKRAVKKAEKEAAEAKAAAEAGDEVDEEEVEVEETPAPKKAPVRKPAAKKATTPARRAPSRKKATDVVEDDEADEDE